MGKDFETVIFKIKLNRGNYRLRYSRKNIPRTLTMDEFEFYSEAFPVRRGIDHPNEISAYMFAEYFKALAKSRSPFADCGVDAKKNTQLFLNWIYEQ
jgi:hypothetical protein